MPPAAGRVEIAVGDICDMDLGLAGGEYRATDRVTSIHHLAAIYHLGVPQGPGPARQRGGTRPVIELAGRAGRLRRLCQFSTASVSGTRKGVIMEDELDEGSSFRNAYEETKSAAEVLARDQPGACQSRSCAPASSWATRRHRRNRQVRRTVLPDRPHRQLTGSTCTCRCPGQGSAPLYLVPVDFVDRRRARPGARRPRGRQAPSTSSDPCAAGRAHASTSSSPSAPTASRRAGRIPRGIAHAALRMARACSRSRARRWPSWSRSTTSRSTTAATRCSSARLGDPIARRSIPTWTTSSPYVREVHAQRKQKPSKTEISTRSTRDGGPRWPTRRCAGAGKRLNPGG